MGLQFLTPDGQLNPQLLQRTGAPYKYGIHCLEVRYVRPVLWGKARDGAGGKGQGGGVGGDGGGVRSGIGGGVLVSCLIVVV